MRKRTVAEIRRLQKDPDRTSPALPSASHQIHHYLRLVAAAGGSSAPLAPVLGMPEQERADARAELFTVDSGTPVVGLNAGAEYGEAKRWPVERFAEAANRLFDTTGCRVLVFGGPSDKALAQQLAGRIQRAPTTVLAGQTSLRQLLSKLACCDVLVTNDTGPMHVAAALGIPVVVPFGSTNPDLTGPGLPGDDRHALLRSQVACSPCFLRICPAEFRCMDSVGVDAIVRAAERILRRRTQGQAALRASPLQAGPAS
jgi:heptosyltransferase-2